jgi:hypothetical protein
MPKIPENLGAIMASASTPVPTAQNAAAEYALSRTSKAAERSAPNYGVDVRDLGEDHHIAILQHKTLAQRVSRDNEGIAVGHVIWNGRTGKIVDAQIVTEHRKNGTSIARLLRDSWDFAAHNRVSGPIGSVVHTAASWRMQKNLNPTFEGFESHPFSEAGTAGGIKTKDISAEEYADTFNKIREQAQAYAETLGEKSARMQPFLSSERDQFATSTRSSYERRSQQRKTEEEPLVGLKKLRENPLVTVRPTSLTRLGVDEQRPSFFGGQISRNTVATSYLINRSSDVELSTNALQYQDVEMPLPHGACNDCGGRGKDTLVAALNTDTLSRIGRRPSSEDDDGTEVGIEFHISPDVSDNPSHSVVHPRVDKRQFVSRLSELGASSVSLYNNAIIAHKTCETCAGTGRNSNAS